MQLPEWSKQEEIYRPDKDRDAFLSRSFLRILQILFSLRAQGRRKTKIPAGCALLFLLYWLILTASSQQPFFLAFQLAGILLLLAFQAGTTIRRVLGAGIAAALFSLLLVAPAVFLGQGSRVFLLPVKTFLSLTSVLLFAALLSWHAVTRALALFHVPQTVIFLLDTTLRSIVILGQEAGEMLTALKLRSVGYNPHKNRAVSGILGNLFLRSRILAEEMYEAMLCRGFTGEYPRRQGLRRTGKAWLYYLFFLLAALVYLFLFLRLEGGFWL